MSAGGRGKKGRRQEERGREREEMGGGETYNIF